MYTSVQVLKVEPDGLLIQFAPSGGGVAMEKVKFENLPEEIQQKYNYDPQKVIAYNKWQKEEQEKAAAKMRADQEQRRALAAEKIRTLVGIVSDYHRAHVYIGKQTGSENNVFVCADMACDVWDMVQKKGIRAMIGVGNPDKPIDKYSFLEANHAWVMAETLPGEWLALETTGGYAVTPSQNPNYYTCLTFRNPKEFRKAYQLLGEYLMAWKKDYEARRAYNDVLKQSNNGGDVNDLKMQLKEKAAVVEQRDSDVKEIMDRLKTINQ